MKLIYLVAVFIGTTTLSCKKEGPVASSIKVDASETPPEGREDSFFNNVAGRTDAKIIREKLAELIGADPNSEIYNLQFGLYRCSIETLIAAGTMGQGGTAVTPVLEIGVSLLDIIYPLAKGLSNPDGAEELPPMSWFDMLKITGNTIFAIMTTAAYDVSAAKAASAAAGQALRPAIEEMIQAGVKLSFDVSDPMKAGLLQKAFASFFAKNPEKVRMLDSLLWKFAGQHQFGAIKNATKANARAAGLSVAMPLLRCSVAIGEGVWVLGQETYGLGKDLHNLRNSAKQVDRMCPQYDAFVQCNKACGGMGINSEFANIKAASSCDRIPELGRAFRGLVIGAYQSSCYEMYCKNNSNDRINQIGQCRVTANASRFFDNSVTGQKRSITQLEAECCNPTTASFEKCSILAGFGG